MNDQISARPAEEKFDGWNDVKAENCYALDADRHGAFAMVIVQMDGDEAPDPEKVARVKKLVRAYNAHEDLLAACELTLDAITMQRQHPGYADALRAAIAKAKEETP